MTTTPANGALRERPVGEMLGTKTARGRRSMRVMLVTGEYPPDEGGVADYTRCLGEALVAEGVDVVVVTSARHTRSRGAVDVAHGLARGSDDAAHGLASAVTDTGVSDTGVSDTGVSDGGVTDTGVTVMRDAPAWGWSTLRWLRERARSCAADWVHIQYQAAAFGMRPAIHLAPRALSWSAEVRTAVTYHDLRQPYLFPKAGRLRRWAVRALSGGSDLTITTSAEDFQAVAAWGSTDRLTLVPIGSNVPDRPPAWFDRGSWRRNAGIGDDEGLLVYFGFLNASKGALDLVDAMAGLAAAGHCARLVMIGGHVGASDPTNVAYLERFRVSLAAEGLGDRVIWTGHIPAAEVSAWLRAADVAALPFVDGASYRRGSLLAMLAHGVPVVTTLPANVPNVPGAPPALLDGRSALLVPPGDTAALTAALSEVLRDAALRARLSSGARELASSFGWDLIAQRHMAEYRRP